MSGTRRSRGLNQRLTFLVSPETYRETHAAAEAQDLSVGEFLRVGLELNLAKARKRATQETIAVEDAPKLLLADLVESVQGADYGQPKERIPEPDEGQMFASFLRRQARRKK